MLHNTKKQKQVESQNQTSFAR